MYKVVDQNNLSVIHTNDFDLAELVTLVSSMIHGRFHKVLFDAVDPSGFNEGRVDPREFGQGPVLAQEIHDLKRAI